MLKSLTLEPQTDRIVHWGTGKITNEVTFWNLRWTTEREGYMPTAHVMGFSTPEEALSRIQEILS